MERIVILSILNNAFHINLSIIHHHARRLNNAIFRRFYVTDELVVAICCDILKKRIKEIINPVFCVTDIAGVNAQASTVY